MSLSGHLIAIFCVALIATGQVLFKLVAEALKKSDTWFDPAVLLMSLTALGLYGVATLVWVGLLQQAPLSRLYPYMALSFVFVALASWLFLSEQVPLAQIAGLGLIVAGILTIAVS